VRAVKVLAVANTYVSALMTGLRCVGRRNGDNLDASHLALVFNKGTELVEVPRVTPPAERPAAFLGVHAPSDVLQVLNGDTLVLFLCLCYELLADAVVHNGGESSLTSFQPFQQLMTVASAFRLDRSSHFVVSVSYVLDLIRGNVSAVRDGYNVRNAHIDTDKVLCVLLMLIGNIYRLVEVELSFDKNEVGFPFCILHELRTVAGICYLLTASDKRDGTDGLGHAVGKHTAVVGDSPELPKVPLLLPVELVRIGNFTDCTHDKLGREMICFLDGIIHFLVQTELLERMAFPRYLRDSVASLVKNAERIFQHHGLFDSWKQLNLQGQFHTTKIQNSFEIFKYLKEIIMLNSTKEGIVAQFLPEAKDFGVSLSRIL